MQYRVTLRLCTKTYYFKRVEDHKLNARELSTFLLKSKISSWFILMQVYVNILYVELAFIFEILFFIQ